MEEELLADLRELRKRIEIASVRFEFEKDPDLIDANIYELESLKARCRYLHKKAKANGVVCRGVEIASYVERGDDLMG